jgi:molybdopterin converting factor subunit 1
MQIKIQYFAILREQTQKSEETYSFAGNNVLELYEEIKSRYLLEFSSASLGVAVNDSFTGWDTKLKDQDSVVFIPPVSGG